MLSPHGEYRVIKKLTKDKPYQTVGSIYKKLLHIDSEHTTKLLSQQLNLIEIRKCNQILKSMDS